MSDTPDHEEAINGGEEPSWASQKDQPTEGGEQITDDPGADKAE